jgi:hypothetical protein
LSPRSTEPLEAHRGALAGAVQAHLAPRRRRFVAKACSAASRRLGTVDIQITSAICMSTDPSPLNQKNCT